MIFLALVVLGAIAWFFSTLVAGGAATLLLPILGVLIGAQLVAPVITVASIIANPGRAWMFREHIHWPLLRFWLPGTLIGAVLGGWWFSLMSAQWLQVLLGLFLISTLFQYRFGQSRRSFIMRADWFFPLGLVVATLSGLVGATGPVYNPFLLNYGLEKEQLVATKAINSLLMQIFKLLAYGAFGALTLQALELGIAVGVGALFGVLAARRHLAAMDVAVFRRLLYWFMPASGILLIIKAFIPA